jgi:septal ring factor EnvC (AmiA/AmiB activator)
MPEATPATTTTTATEATTTAAPAATETTEATTTETTTTEHLNPTVLVREREEARRQAGALRIELKQIKDAQKAAEDATKTEEQKRTERIAELERTLAERETALQERTSYAAVVDAAARLGAAKPAMIHRLIAADIEYEDDGSPKNVDALVRDFLKANPEFTSTAGRPTGDAGQGARGKSNLTRDQIKSMSASEINSRWAEVQEVLKTPA